MIALSLMVLAGYGGMVSLAQITVAGIAAYVVAIFGDNNPSSRLRLAVVGRGAARCSFAALATALIGCDGGADRGHLHDHDHAGDRHGVLLLRAAELRALQRLPRLYADCARPRSSGVNWRDRCRSTTSASSSPVLFFAAVLYGARSTFGLTLQAIRDNPAAHARARLQRRGAQGLRLVPVRHHRRDGGRPAGLVQRPDLAGHHRRRRRRSTCWSSPSSAACATRSGRSSAPVIFVLLQNFAIDIVGGERFNTVIGLVFLVIVLLLAGRAARPVGARSRPQAGPEDSARRTGDCPHRETVNEDSREENMKITRRTVLAAALATGLTSPSHGAGRSDDTIKMGVLATSRAPSRCSAKTASAAPDRGRRVGDKAAGKKIEIIKGLVRRLARQRRGAPRASWSSRTASRSWSARCPAPRASRSRTMPRPSRT